MESFENKNKSLYDSDNYCTLPVVALRGIVVFPDMSLHFDVGRKKSIEALQSAMESDQKVFLIAQKDAAVDDPQAEDIYSVGVICNIKQMLRIPNSNNLRVIVKGEKRGSLVSLVKNKPYLLALVHHAEKQETLFDSKDVAYARALKNEFKLYAENFAKMGVGRRWIEVLGLDIKASSDEIEEETENTEEEVAADEENDQNEAEVIDVTAEKPETEEVQETDKEEE